MFAGLRLWLQRRAQGAPTGVSGTGRPVFRLVLCSDGGDRGFTAIARWVEDTIMCIYKYSLNIMCVCIYIYILNVCMYIIIYIDLSRSLAMFAMYNTFQHLQLLCLVA